MNAPAATSRAAPREIPAEAPVPDGLSLAEINAHMADLDAVQRARWALAHLPGAHVLASSFGIQAAVSLHLMSQLKPDIPVILIDTGYLFAQTYQFADLLARRLNLNLHVYRADISPAWQEARFGQLWTQGRDGLERYNRMNKVEPMARAFADLGAGTWVSGIRREQASSRSAVDFVEHKNGRYKVHPIADWSSRDVWLYLKQHDLPYHPLWDEGYVSLGDVHTTSRLEEGMTPEQTRFFGLKRECGLHTDL